MNRQEAKEIAEKVSLEDLKQMFLNAQKSIKDWSQPSIVNIGLSKGIGFNILSAGIEKHKSADDIHILAKTNMVREFGEYLPNYERKQKPVKSHITPSHQEPKPLPFTENDF